MYQNISTEFERGTSSFQFFLEDDSSGLRHHNFRIPFLETKPLEETKLINSNTVLMMKFDKTKQNKSLGDLISLGKSFILYSPWWLNP